MKVRSRLCVDSGLTTVQPWLLLLLLLLLLVLKCVH
jgi:hypothetical protein